MGVEPSDQNPLEAVGSFLASLQGGDDNHASQPDTDEAKEVDRLFLEPEKYREQQLVDAILDAVIYDKKDRERLSKDPLVRLLIPNRPGQYDFTVVTAMGVITDGKAGTELENGE